MATLRMGSPSGFHRPSARLSALAGFVTNAFWVIALGFVLMYAFFVALGAFSPGDVGGVSIAIALLAILLAAHSWGLSRRAAEGRDPRLVHARERRGF